MLWILLAVGVLLIAIAFVMLFSKRFGNESTDTLAGLIALLGVGLVLLWSIIP
jgi:hypothetical protein